MKCVNGVFTNKEEVRSFLNEVDKYNNIIPENSSSLTNFYLNRCDLLKTSLDIWKDPVEQDKYVKMFNLGPYIPGKRRLYSYLAAIKTLKQSNA